MGVQNEFIKLTSKFERAKRVILNWRREAGLLISHQKSQLMQFSGKAPKETSWCCFGVGEKIQRVTAIKYLGLMIDDKLNWKEQVKLVTKKLNKSSNAMNWIIRRRNCCSTDR